VGFAPDGLAPEPSGGSGLADPPGRALEERGGTGRGGLRGGVFIPPVHLLTS